MDNAPFAEANRVIRRHFFSLIDALSALKSLVTLEGRQQDEHSLMAGVLDVLLQHQDLERCSIFSLRNGLLECSVGRDWQDLTSSALGEDTVRAGRSTLTFRVGEGLIGQAAETGEMQHCRNCSTDDRFKKKGSGGNTPASGSLICAPICTTEEVLGVVNVYHPEPDFFEIWHEHLINLFCDILARILENNRLMRNMEDAVRERTGQLENALQEAENLKSRYEQLSLVDELTNLHNRRFFFPEAEAVLARAARYGHPFSMLIIDIDHFKEVNDTFGHSVGDSVLRDIAAELKKAIREGDIIARFGGEEFVFALHNTPLNGAHLLAERVLESIRRLRWSGPAAAVRTTISIGISSLGERRSADNKSLLDELLRQADVALYFCKSHGRDQCANYIDVESQSDQVSLTEG